MTYQQFDDNDCEPYCPHGLTIWHIWGYLLAFILLLAVAGGVTAE